MKLQVIFLFCLLAVFLTCCRSYPTGAPERACMDMMPIHGVNNGTGGSPYLVFVDVPADGYIAGATYDLTISKVDPDAGTPNFRGFFCQIRELGGIDALGQFSTEDTGTSSGKGKEITCPLDNQMSTSDNAVTHRNRDPVSNYTVHWTAPQPGLGKDITLNALCTIVQEQHVFWEQVQSANRFAGSGSVATVTRIHVSLALCMVIVQGCFSHLLGW